MPRSFTLTHSLALTVSACTSTLKVSAQHDRTTLRDVLLGAIDDIDEEFFTHGKEHTDDSEKADTAKSRRKEKNER